MADVEHYTLHRAIEVAAVTVTALPAYTYANGAAGVGATMTATANGAFPAINGVALTAQAMNGGATANDRSTSGFLLHHGSSRAHNGVWSLTQQGDAGTPWIATRTPGYDTAAAIPGSRLRIRGGTVARGETLTHRNRKAITMGTTGIFYHYDLPRPRFGRREFYDFTSPAPQATANTAVLLGPSVSVTAIGTLSACGTGPGAASPQTLIPANSATLQGVCGGTTGNTLNGFYGLGDGFTASTTQPDGGASLILSQDMAVTYRWRVSTTALSNATNEYADNVGLWKQRVAGQKVPADGVGFIYDRTGPTVGNWRALATVAGVSTGTSIDTGMPVTVNQFDLLEIHSDAGDLDIVLSINETVVATFNTTNVPTELLAMLAVCFKNVGVAGVCGLTIDSYEVDVQWPQGRY